MTKIQVEINATELSDTITREIARQIKALENHFQPKAPTEYLTRNQVAEMLQVNLSTLYSWNKKGILKPIGIGKRVYYRREDIKKAMKEL